MKSTHSYRGVGDLLATPTTRNQAVDSPEENCNTANVELWLCCGCDCCVVLVTVVVGGRLRELVPFDLGIRTESTSSLGTTASRNDHRSHKRFMKPKMRVASATIKLRTVMVRTLSQIVNIYTRKPKPEIVRGPKD